MQTEILLINSFIYSIISYFKKSYFLEHVSIEIYIALSSFLTIVFYGLYYLYNPTSFINKKNIAGIRKILPTLLIIKIIALLNGYLYYYLMKTEDFGYFNVMTRTSVMIFTTLLGVYLLDEQLNNYNIIGILFCIIGLYLINS